MESLYQSAVIRPQWVLYAEKVSWGILQDQARYRAIQGMKSNGVPWFVVAAIHERESTRSFTRHLHEGSPLTGRTRNIPKGRIPEREPPYTFEESAEDALYTLKGLDAVNWGSWDTLLDTVERYNGLGYRLYHPETLSPYLWSGTNHYTRGKYVADGKYSPSTVDKQIGAVAIFKTLEKMD